MSKTAQDNQKGFTLIEVMIAMLILSLGILGVLKMQVTAVKGNSFSIGLTEAATFAQNKVEELAALVYDDVDLNDDDNDVNNGTGQDTTADGGIVNGVDNDDDTPAVFVDGIANFGLDDKSTITNTTEADGFQQETGATNIVYDISWNIAVDKPAANAKHIRVHVQWQAKGMTRTVSLDRIKADF